MRITIEHYDNEYSIKIPDETILPDLLEHLDALLKQIGYCYEGILDIVDMEDDVKQN